MSAIFEIRNKPVASLPTAEGVAFADATFAEMAAMLDAHYNNPNFHLDEFWHVGDEKLIDLNATPNNSLNTLGTGTFGTQKMKIRIIGMDHDDLTTSIGNKTKAAATLEFTNCVSDGSGGQARMYYWGKSNYPVDDSLNYSTNPVREWFATTFVDTMLPSDLGVLVKNVDKKNLAKHTATTGAPVITSDKGFFLSYPEVFGTTTYSYYLSGSAVGDWEGTQYQWYQDHNSSSNRIKYWSNNDGSNGSAYPWWLRSPSSYYNSSIGYYWCGVYSSGGADSNSGNGYRGLAPAFAI